MAQSPSHSVLDAELTSLVRRSSENPWDGKSLLLAASESSGSGRASPAELVSLKLVAHAGCESRAAAWIESEGGQVLSAGQEVLLANLPVAVLGRLENHSWVRRAEAPRKLFGQLDACRGVATGLDEALTRYSLSGAGVVVGIVDTGLDWMHPDFTTEDGSSRVERLVFAHHQPATQVWRYDEFDNASLNNALRGEGELPPRDPHGHGTHCASIAAGNGTASGGRFRGVAPRATLMAVRSEPLLDTHAIWAVRRIFETAGERPAVISLSLGGHLGAHDGTSALENVISREAGPGRIVVVAAGNDAERGVHWQGELVKGEDLLIPVRIADPRWQFIDVWVPRGDEVEVYVETPDGAQFEPGEEPVETAFGTFEATWRRDPINGDQNLTLVVQAGRNHTWKIRLRPRRILHGEVHAWSGTPEPSTSQQLFIGEGSRKYSLAMPATEERAITVSSWISRTTFESAVGVMRSDALAVGQLSPFSSHGPTRYGRMKPDIAAPGQYVTAALAQDCKMALEPQYQPRLHPSGRYVTTQGTSMAAPFVAGVVALLLEREPKLTPEEIQDRLRLTARRDEHTGRVWNSGFGFGKIDVEALLSYGG